MLVKSFLEEGKQLFNKKMNLIVLFLLPVLVVLMMGFELEQEVISNIPMAVIDNDGTDFSRDLIESFDKNLTFQVTAYPDTEEEMEALIRDSEVRVGLIIPENFYSDVSTLESPTVLMVYDGSHMSITGTTKAKAVEILLTYKTGAAMKQIASRLEMSEDEALKIAQVIRFENRMLYNPAKSFEDFLAPILMAGYVQAAIALVASVAIDHEIYRKRGKERLGYALGKILFYTVAGTLSYLICIVLQVQAFGIPFRGNMMDAVILTLALCFAASSFSVLVSALFRKRPVAMIACGVLFIPNSSMAGTTWPLGSMPIGYQAFGKYMPFAHFVNNLRNIYLKGSGLADFGVDVAYMFLFGGIVLMITELVLLVAKQEEGEEVSHELSTNVQDTVSVNLQ